MGEFSGEKHVHRLANRGDAAGLLEVLERGHGKYACQAAIALARLDDRRAVDPILVRLRAIDLTSPTTDEVEQWKVLARALGDLADPGSPAADELLVAIEARPVAWAAIEALEAMGEQLQSGRFSVGSSRSTRAQAARRLTTSNGKLSPTRSERFVRARPSTP